jgi:hypothetical protein
MLNGLDICSLIHLEREREREKTISFIGLRNRKLKHATTEGADEFHEEKAAKIRCYERRNRQIT